MADIYDRYGMREAYLQRIADDLRSTLAVLKDVCNGEIAPERVVFTENGWTLNPEMEPTPLTPSEK